MGPTWVFKTLQNFLEGEVGIPAARALDHQHTSGSAKNGDKKDRNVKPTGARVGSTDTLPCTNGSSVLAVNISSLPSWPGRLALCCPLAPTQRVDSFEHFPPIAAVACTWPAAGRGEQSAIQ